LIWKLLEKDLLRRVRNPAGFLLLLFIPFAFALLIGLAFGPSAQKKTAFKIKLLIDDRDKGFASQMLKYAFGQGELASLFTLESVQGDTGRVLIDAGKASALLVIPAGFSDSLLHQKPTELSLVKNPSETFGPKIAEETVRMFAEAGDRLARIAAEPLKRIGKRTDLNESPPEAEIASISIQISRLVNRISKYLLPPKITLDVQSTLEKKKENDSSNFYAANVSRIMVMCLLFLLDVFLRDFYEEKENRTQHRIRIGPVGTNTYVASKILFAFLSGLASLGIVWAGIVALFGVRMDALQWFTFVPFSCVTALALIGVVMPIQAFTRTRSQAQAFAPAVIILFSMLGGCMMPMDVLPPFIQKAAVISPVYWAVNGLQGITIEHAGLLRLMPHFLVLSTVAVVFPTLSFLMIRRKIET
jgi:ABC-2 type transport system permease protein